MRNSDKKICHKTIWLQEKSRPLNSNSWKYQKKLAVVSYESWQSCHMRGITNYGDIWGVPAHIYLFKFNNRNRIISKICSKLTTKTVERRHWRHSGAFIANFNRLHTSFRCFHCWLWTSNCWLWWYSKNRVFQFISLRFHWIRVHASVLDGPL